VLERALISMHSSCGDVVRRNLSYFFVIIFVQHPFGVWDLFFSWPVSYEFPLIWSVDDGSADFCLHDTLVFKVSLYKQSMCTSILCLHGTWDLRLVYMNREPSTIVLFVFIWVSDVRIAFVLEQMDKILAAYRKASKQWCATTNKLAQGTLQFLPVLPVCCPASVS
jgi:hypothetical protein